MPRRGVDWTTERLARIGELIGQGLGRVRIAPLVSAEFGVTVTPNMIAGLTTRHNFHRPPALPTAKPNHAAIRSGHTLYPSRVRDPATRRRRSVDDQQSGLVLITGRNQRKLGHRVEKGAWAGMPMFSLSLEERATCPSHCGNWSICYGNSMHMSVRYRHGPALERAIERELADLQCLAPGGFVVRLHLLGDFYSVAYVALWAKWLARYPGLRVFGYTAYGRKTEIGAAVARLAHRRWDRFAIRLSSSEPGPERAVTLWGPKPAGTDGLVCPVETGKSQSCSTCALCWSPAFRGRPIFFLAHGG